LQPKQKTLTLNLCIAYHLSKSSRNYLKPSHEKQNN
jgi:hypothetical protein